MKLALLACSSHFVDRVMAKLKENDIDSWTRWDGATRKGHGAEPHLGAGAFGSTNSVLPSCVPCTKTHGRSGSEDACPPYVSCRSMGQGAVAPH